MRQLDELSARRRKNLSESGRRSIGCDANGCSSWVEVTYDALGIDVPAGWFLGDKGTCLCPAHSAGLT